MNFSDDAYWTELLSAMRRDVPTETRAYWPGGIGGLRPVAGDTNVKLWLRSGEVVTGAAGSFYWARSGAADDIMYYRVLGEPASNGDGWVLWCGKTGVACDFPPGLNWGDIVQVREKGKEGAETFMAGQVNWRGLHSWLGAYEYRVVRREEKAEREKAEREKAERVKAVNEQLDAARDMAIGMWIEKKGPLVADNGLWGDHTFREMVLDRLRRKERALEALQARADKAMKVLAGTWRDR